MRKLFAFLFLIGIFAVCANTSLAGEGCIGCHENAEVMLKSGYPQFMVTSSEIKAQTKMPASCPECHFGNPNALTKKEAHKDMLTVNGIGTNWSMITRAMMPAQDLGGWATLEPRGKNRATQLMPKLTIDGRITDNLNFKLIIYHDRNPETLAFNPVVAEKTCGLCHKSIVDSYLKSPMGGGRGAHAQSQYRTWTGPTGPQSCGLWVGTLAQAAQDKFTDGNVNYFNGHSVMPITEKAAYNTQRICNQCHVGCLDCHFNPQKRDNNNPAIGSHMFLKKPTNLSCYGGGKSFSCHAGPLERRRGDGYLREEFTQASTSGREVLKGKPDIHEQENISCVDCHEPNRKTGYHADLRRDVDCAKCHAREASEHRKGQHKSVDCTSCHVTLIGGYAFNFWSVRGENPLTRLQGYYVDAVTPLLLKNPKGVWIPVHVVPHTSGNVKAEEVSLSKTLLFRDRPDSAIDRAYISNDSYAVTGLAKNVDDKDHDVLVWLNIDRVAHGIGKSRTCESCHASKVQRIPTRFEANANAYKGVKNGEYTIMADGKGLRVVDFKGPDGAIPKGLEPFKDLWSLRGDFALPKIKSRKLYDKMEEDYRKGKFVH
ncbi:MAG TPA: hypothetical protein DCP92_09100 [Nitrospiraceae bacterium]|nr:hypothetical protein [Nitrospiraceae bacterium]